MCWNGYYNRLLEILYVHRAGYYMLVSSQNGLIGDRVQLTSPLTNFSTPVAMTFRYGFMSNSPDTHASLVLYLYSKLRVLVMRKLIAAIEDEQPSGWQTGSVCLPNGTYYVTFEAKHGQTFSTSLFLDAIEISAMSCDPRTVSTFLYNIPGSLYRCSILTVANTLNPYTPCFKKKHPRAFFAIFFPK